MSDDDDGLLSSLRTARRISARMHVQCDGEAARAGRDASARVAGLAVVPALLHLVAGGGWICVHCRVAGDMVVVMVVMVIRW